MGTVFVMPLSKGAAFDRLAEEVAREYEAKGYSREHALEIGRAVAGKIARKKCKAGRRRKSLAPMLILPLAKANPQWFLEARDHKGRWTRGGMNQDAMRKKLAGLTTPTITR